MKTMIVVGLLTGLTYTNTTAWQKPIPAAQQYLFIDVTTPGGLKRELAAAGSEGFTVQASSSLCVILKRGTAGPRTFMVVAENRDTNLIKELNEAGALGFQVLPNGAMTWADDWVIILEKRKDGSRFVYTGVKGDDNLQQGLDAARKTGATVVAALGKAPGAYSLRGGNPPPIVILEQNQTPGAPAAPTGAREYRVVSTQRTATLEKEVMEAGAFRVIGSGFMTVVMERDPRAAGATAERRVIATTRFSTFENELKDAGMQGFRVVAIPDKKDEMIAVLERAPGTARPIEYAIEAIKEKTVDEQIKRFSSTGFTFSGLFGRFAFFEKSTK